MRKDRARCVGGQARAERSLRDSVGGAVACNARCNAVRRRRSSLLNRLEARFGVDLALLLRLDAELGDLRVRLSQATDHQGLGGGRVPATTGGTTPFLVGTTSGIGGTALFLAGTVSGDGGTALS